MAIGNKKSIESLLNTYQRVQSGDKNPDKIREIREEHFSMGEAYPYDAVLSDAKKALLEISCYLSVADMEPENDPEWEESKNRYGIVNPPDSLEDMGGLSEGGD